MPNIGISLVSNLYYRFDLLRKFINRCFMPIKTTKKPWEETSILRSNVAVVFIPTVPNRYVLCPAGLTVSILQCGINDFVHFGTEWSTYQMALILIQEIKKMLDGTCLKIFLVIQPFLKFFGCIWSTVRLRFRKSISGHNFQTIRKLANNDFQYHREVIYNT